MKQPRRRLAAICILIAIIIIAGLSIWLVVHNHTAASKTATSPPASKIGFAINASPVIYKQYTNNEFGFSFQYPSAWKISEDLHDIGRGGLEGNISATSPNGSIVTYNANLGGKGGDCWDDEANARTTRTCMTKNTLQVDKLPAEAGVGALYFYKASLTPATAVGGDTTYYVGLADDRYSIPAIGSTLVDVAPIIIQTNNYYLNISVTGKDDASNTSQTFFDSTEVKEATIILKSTRLMPATSAN